MQNLKSMCVYCGHKTGDRPIFTESAEFLGRDLARNDIRLIYGGGALGLMGTVARTAHDNGGKVFGVIPEFLVEVEGLLPDIEHEIVKSMHERKMMMFEQADAICTMPGGIGTLEEIIEVVSWARMELHRKPVVLLNLEGFWSPLVELIDHIIERGFAAPELREDLIVVDRAEDVIPAAEEALCNLSKNCDEAEDFEEKI